MAVRQYIGARYVPRFVGNYDPTQSYEALDVVDNGSGTSYIAKIPTPANTPLTDTNHWFLYGSTSGAIVNLQQQINDMKDGTVPGSLQEQIDTNTSDITALKKNPTKRKYILIGDSYSLGIRGGGQSWVTGWATYVYNILPNDVYYFAPGDATPSFEGAGAFLGTTTWYDLFDWVVANKLGNTDPLQITDVVILGGSNEPVNQSSALANHIANTFVPHVRSVCPNAEIKIGCFGLNAQRLVTGGIYAGYRDGVLRSGATFISDLLNLGAMSKYDTGYGHFTEEGYNAYNPFVAQAVFTGHAKWQWSEYHDVTINNNVTINGVINFAVEVTARNDRIEMSFIDKARGRGWDLINALPWTGGTLNNTALDTANTEKIYVAFRPGSPIASAWTMDHRDGGWIGACKCLLTGDNTNGWHIVFQTFINRSSSPLNNTDITFVWDGTNRIIVWEHNDFS